MIAGNFFIVILVAAAAIQYLECVARRAQNLTAVHSTPRGNGTVTISRRGRSIIDLEMDGDDGIQLLRLRRAPKGGGGGTGGLGSAIGQGVASGAAGVGASVLGNAILGGGR